ncbi:transposase, partial [Mycobacterium tuberculosis]
TLARILGWRVAFHDWHSMVLDAIEQAIWTATEAYRPERRYHHTDRGSQYTSIRFSERLAEAGIQPSVGAVGSSYDNALAETINGLYKTELIKPGKPWRSIEDVELATARWVDWFNHRRLYQYCGDVPPVELEAAYYAQRQRPAAG